MLARPELDQASLDILAAGDYILQNGWCQNKRSSLDGEVCMLGALSMVTSGVYHRSYTSSRHDRFSVAYDKLRNFLGCSIWTFNDKANRTKDEVIKALKEAAYT